LLRIIGLSGKLWYNSFYKIIPRRLIMNKYDVLLVEDDVDDSKAMQEEIARTENFLLAKATNSCFEAYSYIINDCPSAVILDLEMNRGYGDGMELLAKLHSLSLKHKPYIVVTTNNVSTVTLNRTKQLGADYGFTKIKPDYSPKIVMDHLKAVMLSDPQNVSKEIEEQREQRLENRIRGIFDSLGITRNIGFEYLVRAVMLNMEGRQQKVAKLIAEQYGKSEDSVSKAMKYALESAWNNNNTAQLKQYKGPIKMETGCPVYTSFSIYYAQLLSKEF